MTIHWLYLFIVLVLLWPPLPVRGAVWRFLKSRRNPSVHTAILFKRWQNWVDLVRGAVGAYILSEFALDIDPEIKGAGTKALMLQGCLLGLALVFQIVRYKTEFVLAAPVFFLSGITLVYGGLAAGGFSVFVGWIFAIGGNRPIYQLPAMGVALGGSGYLLGLSLPLIMNCGLVFLPLFIAFMAHKPLAFVTDEPPGLPR